MGCFRSLEAPHNSWSLYAVSKPHSAWYSSEDSISTVEEITLKTQLSFKKNKMTQHKMYIYISVFPLLLPKKCSNISLKGSEERGTWKYLAFTSIILHFSHCSYIQIRGFWIHAALYSIVIRNSKTDMLNFLFKFSCCSPVYFILQ